MVLELSARCTLQQTGIKDYLQCEDYCHTLYPSACHIGKNCAS